MSEEPRIGVYVCHCGINIAGTIYVKDVVEYAKTLPNVIEAKDYVFMCSAPGQGLIKEDIEKCKLNRVVVAACSPAMHEPTFRAVLAEAGLNPYLLEMVNIREHSSWVHEEKDKATEKAKDLVRMAVAKARLLEPLEEIRFEVKPSALILGGGVSGLKAALDLAERGFRVYVVEKRPTLGGNAARLGRLAHIDMKGTDLASTIIRAASSNPNIVIYTNSELTALDGSVGDFTAKVRVKSRFVNTRCNLCGECVKACPEEVPNEYEFGIAKRKAIYLPFREAYPPLYVIDPESCTRCGKCVEVCPQDAINLDEESKDIEINVGTVILATGHKPYEPPKGEYGYGESGRVITLFQLERLLDETGPTGGKLEVDGITPNTLAFIMCVGSLGTTENAHPYCSRMCCSSALKNALRIKEKYPDSDIYVIYRDIRTYGRGDEKLYELAGEKLVKFIRFEEPPKVKPNSDKVEIQVYDTTLGEWLSIKVDAVVLVVGMSPSEDIDKVREIVKVGCGPEGFVKEAHLKLRPVEAPADGIYLAGTITGPKNIVESMMAGGAAAAKAAALFARREVEVEPIIAQVNEEICSGCAICVAMCPYDAISLKEKDEGRVAHVDKALCKACGACAAACPSGAMQQAGYKDAQVLAQVRAIHPGGGG